MTVPKVTAPVVALPSYTFDATVEAAVKGFAVIAPVVERLAML